MSTRLDLPRTLAGLHAALTRGEFSVAEALAEQHRRCAENDLRWHACVPGTLRDVGGDIDARADRTALRPLSGAFLLHKDVFDVAGRRPGCGALPDAHAARDTASVTAPVLRALAAAGATYGGALTLAQYACGATAENPAHACLVNPLDADAMVGGSSSGSAVAVAGDLCYASLGTDTAGSVRIPAASCGLVGLKTTAGALPAAGVMPLAASLDSVGVLARNAADARRVFAAAASLDETIDTADAGAPMRIVSAYEDDALDTDIGDALEACEAALARGLAPGVTLHRAAESARIDADRRERWSRSAQTILHAQAARVHAPRLREGGIDALPAPMQGVVLPGIALPGAWVAAAHRARAPALANVLRECFGDADALLCPALPIALPDRDVVHTDGPRFSVHALLALHRHTAWVNYVGLPAIVFPIGADRRGRPVSAQLIGRPYRELQLLALLGRLEAAGIASSAVWPARAALGVTAGACAPVPSSFVAPRERPAPRLQD
ncbi:amidase family protein [Caballeronia cordobensis]|uniref:amidase family protein n=1 Tax=Caballeronia cordobensis TaxID=1353886 RepID=UPI00045EFEBB|nr:putative amidase [Burkholderia sp. RPE67]